VAADWTMFDTIQLRGLSICSKDYTVRQYFCKYLSISNVVRHHPPRARPARFPRQTSFVP
jgi:hypothetical protein